MKPGKNPRKNSILGDRSNRIIKRGEVIDEMKKKAAELGIAVENVRGVGIKFAIEKGDQPHNYPLTPEQGEFLRWVRNNYLAKSEKKFRVRIESSQKEVVLRVLPNK